jgi:hypothetical protein
MSGDGQALRTDKLTLQTILQRGYAAYERTHALPAHVRRSVWAILACRTAVLGGHVQACPEGLCLWVSRPLNANTLGCGSRGLWGDDVCQVCDREPQRQQ